MPSRITRITLTILLSITSTANAAIWYVDASNIGAEDGTAWGTAYDTIQEGVDAAAADYATNGGAPEVWVAAGTYTATADPVVTMAENVHLYGGFLGSETERAEREWVANTSIIDGEDTRRGVFGASSSTLDGFTVTHGYTSNNGGGIFNSSASPAVTNCTFSGNSALNGGGMYSLLSSPIVTNCAFSGNTAVDYGGGMDNRESSATVTNCTFSGNTARSGGGMVNGNALSITVTNCTFSANSADWGAGMYNSYSSPLLINCTFSGNVANNQGGGLRSEHSSPVLKNCIFWNNTAINGNDIQNVESTHDVSYSCVAGGYPGDGNIDVDPFLRALETGQILLQASSPCIDTGTAAGAPGEDIFGTVRPQGTAVDMGAHEYTDDQNLGLLTVDIAPETAVLYGAQWTVNSGITWHDSGESVELAQGSVTVQYRGIGQWDTPPISTIAMAWGGNENATGTYIEAPGKQLYFVDVNTVASKATQNGLSWATAFDTIQEGIDAASTDYLANGGVPEIWVSQGTYSGIGGISDQNGTQVTSVVFLKEGAHLYGGFVGTESNRTERDWESNATIIDGENTRQGIYSTGIASGRSALDGFTVRNGQAEYGGGMHNVESSSPTITNCTFSGNMATNRGGGMYNRITSSPTLTNCTFSGNTTVEFGGGMFNQASSSPVLTNCVFSENTANNSGGGMSNDSSSSPAVIGCTFSGNSTEGSGGGMYNFLLSSPTVTNCTFSENSARQGGGMSNDNAASPTVMNCIFSDNTATSSGGGVDNLFCSLTLIACEFRGNSSESTAGALSIDETSADITNCIFLNNSAGSRGGAISTVAPSGQQTTNIRNSTIAFNEAAQGSAIGTSDYSPTLVNCIVWGNSAEAISVADATSDPIISYSIIQGGYTGDGNIESNPSFVGALNGDLHLRGNSPAIDVGTNLDAPNDDLDGDARPFNVTVDMGADEYDPATSDSDGDGETDAVDTDDDNDGVPDDLDVAPFDDAPTISPTVPDIAATEDTVKTVDLSVYETDAEDDDPGLTWTASGASESLFMASVDTASDTLTISPVLDQSGSDVVRLTLNDSSGQTDTQDITITVEPVNDAPVVASIGGVSFSEDEGDDTLDLDVPGADVDNSDAELTWSATGHADVTVAVDAVSHVVTFGGAPDWNGAEDITFRATDPGGLFGEAVVRVTVVPVNDAPFIAPVIPNVIIETNGDIQIDLTSYENDIDTDGDALTWSVSAIDDLVLSATVDAVTGTLLLTSLSSSAQETSITLSLHDDGGLSASQSFVAMVTGDTDADGMPSAWERDNGLDPDLDDAGDDPDGDGLTNLEEFGLLTNPQREDSDGDGMRDGWEVEHGFAPLSAADAGDDADSDGLSNLEEFLIDSDPNDSSSPASAFYVSPSGSDDTGDGTQSNPWGTISFAMEQLPGIATATHPIALHLLAGTFVETVAFVPHVTLIGSDASDPGATVIESMTQIVVAAAENTAIRDLSIRPDLIVVNPILLRINDVSMHVENVIVDGRGKEGSLGIEILGVNSSSTVVENSTIRQVDSGVVSLESNANITNNLFETIQQDAVRILPPGTKGATGTTLQLGDATDGTTGANTFGGVQGDFIDNGSSEVMKAEANDWGIYTFDEISAKMTGGRKGSTGNVDFLPIACFSGVLSSSIFVAVQDESGAAISGAEVSLEDAPGDVAQELTLGVYEFKIACNLSNTVIVSADGFSGQSKQVVLAGNGDLGEVVFNLVPDGGEGEGEGEGEEPSQEIAQRLLDQFEAADFTSNSALSFAEARVVIEDLTQAAFDALDVNGDGQLTAVELEAHGAIPPPTGGGCNGKSAKALRDLKESFGDLFLLGLLSLVLVGWRGFGVRA